MFALEGASVIYQNTATLWFKSLNNGNMELIDEPRWGHPSVVDDDVLLECVDLGPHQNTCNLWVVVGASNANFFKSWT